jgi:hypothetical protein
MHFPFRCPRNVVWLIVAFGIAGLLAGCPGSLEDPGEFHFVSGPSGEAGPAACTSTEAAAVPTTLFATTCGLSTCHSPAGLAQGGGGDLDLVSSGLVDRLLNMPTDEMPTLTYIDSAQPTESVIYTKLQAGTVPFGSEMPFGGPYLSTDQVACVLAWIESVVPASGLGVDASVAGDSSALDSATGRESGN